MTEAELRALVREAVLRHSAGQSAESAPGASAPAGPDQAPGAPPHPSFVRYLLPAGDGRCLIEPAVRCTHCGYCQSHGY